MNGPCSCPSSGSDLTAGDKDRPSAELRRIMIDLR